MQPFTNRIENVQSALRESGLDAALVVSQAGTCYLSGCYLLTQAVIPARQAFVLITADGQAGYLVCNIEAKMAREDSRITDLQTYVEFKEEPEEAAVRMLKNAGLETGRIGIESRTLPFRSLAHLQQELPAAAFPSWDAALAEIMMIKDSTEIAALETAGRQTQAAIEAGLAGAAPGSREVDVAGGIWDRLLRTGMTPMFNVFASGPRTVLVHGEPGERVMKPGEIVRLDMGGRFPSFYLSDMARTAVVGDADKTQAAAFNGLVTAQSETIAAVRPGVPASALFDICRRSFESRDLPFSMPHIGHGLGIGLHEAPMIHPGNPTPLQVGMVLNIEPFLLLEDRQEGYHVEDLVEVTPDGFRLLTDPQTELIRIPA